MPKWDVTTPDGRIFEIEADREPTQQEIQDALQPYQVIDNQVGASASAFRRGFAGVGTGTVSGAGALLSLVPGMDDNFIQRAGTYLQESLEESSPISPFYQDTVATKASETIGQALGQLGSIYVGGGAGSVIGGTANAATRGAQIAGLGVGALQGAASGEQMADRLGLENRLQRAAAIIGSGAIELGTEMIGGFGTKEFTQGLLGQLPSALRRGGVGGIVRTGLGEGGEEVIAATANPILERIASGGTTAPSGVEMSPIPFLTQEGTLDALEQGAYGALAGAVMGGASNFINSNSEAKDVFGWQVKANARMNELRNAPSLTPDESRELEELQTKSAEASDWLSKNAGISPEQSQSAINQLLTPPSQEEQLRINQEASDPAVQSTESIASEIEPLAPATAEALRNSVDIIKNNETIENEEIEIQETQNRLNEVEQDEVSPQVADVGGVSIGETSINQTNVTDETLPQQEITSSDTVTIETPTEEITDETIAETAIPTETSVSQPTLAEEAGQPASEGVSVGQDFLGEVGVQTEGGVNLSISEDQGGIMDAVGRTTSPTLNQSTQFPSFEQALRAEAADLPAWTEARIQQALEWDRNGRQGDPPWGKPVVNRAILASDEGARQAQIESEKAALRKEREQVRKYGRDNDVDDVVAKADIARQETEFNEIPTEEVSLSSSSGNGNQNTTVTRSDAQEALDNLRKTEVGRLLADEVLIVETIDDLQAALGNDPLPASALDLVRDAEGFFRPKTGQSIVILGNVAVYPGETATDAVARVIFHERAFHGGFKWAYNNDPIFRLRAQALIKEIPEAEAQSILERYPELDRDSVQLLEEWMANKWDGSDPNELAKRDPFFKRVWEAFKAFVSRALGKPLNSQQVEREAKSLIAQVLNDRKAFRDQSVPNPSGIYTEEGDINSTLPESRVKPYNQQESDYNKERLRKEAGIPENQNGVITLQQRYGLETDQPKIRQSIRPMVDFVRPALWVGGVNEEGQPLTNKENDDVFWRENDKMTSEKEQWGPNWQRAFQEYASQSSDPVIRAHGGDVTASIVQMELANYAQQMAADNRPDFYTAVQAVQRGKYDNDVNISIYSNATAAGRILQARSMASRGTPNDLGFWQALSTQLQGVKDALNNKVGDRPVSIIRDALENPEDSDINDEGVELPPVVAPAPPSVDVRAEEVISDWRSALEQDGAERIADAFMGITLGSQSEAEAQGPLMEANDALNRTLSQILNETARDMGLLTPRPQETPEQRRQRIIVELGLNDLRSGKITEIDELVKERLAGIAAEDQELAAQLFSKWEQISSSMRGRSISGSTSRRVIYDVFNERKAQEGNELPTSIIEIARLPEKDRPTAIKSVIDRVLDGLRQTSQMDQPDGVVSTISDQDLARAEKSLRATMDNLLANAYASMAKAAQAKAERAKARELDRHNQRVAKLVDQYAEAFSDTLTNQKKNADELRELVNRYLKSPFPEFKKELSDRFNVSQENSSQLERMLDEQRRRSEVIESAKERQDALEKPDKEADAVINRLATSQSDTLKWKATAQKSKVRDAIDAYLDHGNGAAFEKDLKEAGVSDSKATTLRKVLDEEIRRGDILAREKKREAEKAAPTKEAKLIIDRIDESRTEWAGPKETKSSVRRLKEEAVQSELTDRSRPGYLTRDGFIERYSKAFQDLGVEAGTSINLSSRLYDENIRLRGNQAIREMDSKVTHGGVKGLVRSLMESSENVISNPALMEEAMVNWLREVGLTEQQAKDFSKKYAPIFKKKVIEAQNQALDRALKVVGKMNVKTIDAIRAAIRNGSYAPGQLVQEALASALGIKQLSQEDIRELALIDRRMQGADNLQYNIELGKMHAILKKKAANMSSLKRITSAWVHSVLSGLGTVSLGFTVPASAALSRVGVNLADIISGTITGRLKPSEAATNIAAGLGDLIDGYRNYITGFKSTWKNDIAVTHIDQTLNHLDSMREDMNRQIERFKKGSPTEKIKAAMAIAQDATDIVRRIMNAADGAQLMVFEHIFMRQGARKMLMEGPNAMPAGEVGDLFMKASFEGQQAAERAITELGYTEDQARQVGFDATNQFIQQYVTDRLGDEPGASQLREYARKESMYELGFGSEQGATWDVFNMIANGVQSLSSEMGKTNPLAARGVAGFVSIPVNLAIRAMSYTPYGLLKVYWKNKDLAKNLDSKLYEKSMGTTLQIKQRKIEGIAGTVGMMVLAALALAGDDDDRDFTGLRVTGAGPNDQARRDAWLKQGWKPNSITWVVNGKPTVAVAYGRGGFESLKMPLLSVGALNDMKLDNKLSNGNALENVASWARASSTSMLDASSFFGMKNLANLVGLSSARTSESSIAGNIAWNMSGIVPFSGFINGITKSAVGPMDLSSAKAAIIANIPIVNAALSQPAYNFLGDQKGIKNVDLFTKASDRAYLNGLPLFINMEPSSDTGKLYEMFIRKGSAPSVPSRARLTTERGHVTDEQWGRYVKTRGEIIKKLTKQRASRLNAMNREDFSDAISSISSEATKEAKKKVFGKNR